jgi:hypothetical protein
MNKQLRDEWVKALRSGEYKQARKTLQHGDAYCCLGVLCVVAEKIGFEAAKRSDYPGEGRKLQGNYLTAQPVGKYLPAGADEELVNLNDQKLAPFPVIADWIEKNIPVKP